MEKLLEITFGYAAPFMTKTAVLLGIPDILTQGPLSLDQILEHLPSKAPNADVVARIMRFLVANEVFAAEIVNGERRYSNTDVSKLLVKEDPNSYAYTLLMLTDKVYQDPWHEIHRVILEDVSDCFKLVHGSDIWSFSGTNPSANKLFNAAMASKTKTSVAAILKGYNGFDNIASMVDVGGGNGYFLSKVVAAYPHLHGINFDRPHVIDVTPEIPGVEHVAGDMFESIPCAEAVFLQSVLHDWGDDECIQILKNCFNAIPPHGKVLIADHNLSDERFAKVAMSVDMTMIAHTGGKERTEEEFEYILTKAGFKRMNVVDLSNPHCIFEAYKI